MNKFNAQNTMYDGLVFDSLHERKRYVELKLLMKAKEIRDLKIQVPFVLIPEIREESTEIYKSGPHKGEKKPGKLLEKQTLYIADFTYYDKDGNYVVEDAKGLKKGAAYQVFVIKRKLMLHKYGIRVIEV